MCCPSRADNAARAASDARTATAATATAAYQYYAFGSPMPGRYGLANLVGQGGYRYGFNGKEKDDDLTKATGATYDYGFRIYDARIAKFLSVDPLTKDYPELTSYQFASNTPIMAIDQDGLEKVLYTFTYSEGKWETTKIELKKAGPLGDGALVKFGTKYFYGNELPSASDFTKFYENKENTGYILKGETWVTIGYGHACKDSEDKLMYKEGTTISDKEVNSLFEKDFKARRVNVPGEDQFFNDALSDYSFNTTDKASKTEKTYSKSSDKGAIFFLKHSKGGTGIQKRRAAEYILANDKSYYGLDYSKSAQKKWGQIFDKLITGIGQSEEKTKIPEKPKTK